jgi:hypothetical protein
MKRTLLITLPFVLMGVVFSCGAQAGSPHLNPAGMLSASPGGIVRQAQRRWRADLVSGALADPKKRFPSPSWDVLRGRLRVAEKRYGFEVIAVAMFHPRQAAPLVLVRATKKRAFAQATPAILRLIDPKRKTGDDRTGWAYEGFFFKAVDPHGVPFLFTFNHFRGQHAGGGQWASRGDLFPFPHG